jgi:hypothetical protein
VVNFVLVILEGDNITDGSDQKKRGVEMDHNGLISLVELKDRNHRDRDGSIMAPAVLLD